MAAAAAAPHLHAVAAVDLNLPVVVLPLHAEHDGPLGVHHQPQSRLIVFQLLGRRRLEQGPQGGQQLVRGRQELRLVLAALVQVGADFVEVGHGLEREWPDEKQRGGVWQTPKVRG